MTLEDFCVKLEQLGLPQVREALSILWFHDEKQIDTVMSAGQLAKIIRDSGLGNPNSTQLGKLIRASGKVNATKAGFRLNAIGRAETRAWLDSILGDVRPNVDQDLGYLPSDVWQNTRGYIERVCLQLNGCYQFEYYDAASVMLRRLVETLLIESYEYLRRDDEIRDSNRNFYMLKELINRATVASPLGIGRDAKEALGRIKEMGDRSAHNRRYNAVRADLEKVQSGARVLTDELINLANLRKAQ